MTDLERHYKKALAVIRWLATSEREARRRISEATAAVDYDLRDLPTSIVERRIWNSNMQAALALGGMPKKGRVPRTS